MSVLAALRQPPACRLADLTPCQRAVLVQVASYGRSNIVIGRALCISPSTVKNHISLLFDRVGARNRIELVRWAWSRPDWPAVDRAAGGASDAPRGTRRA